MIRSNNPAIDFGTLRAKVRAASERLRARGLLDAPASGSEAGVTPRALLDRYRIANRLLDRAEDFAYPQHRLPNRLALLDRISPFAGRVLLRAYNFALRPAREASLAQTQAVKEVIQAGMAVTDRLIELENSIAQLRETIDRSR